MPDAIVTRTVMKRRLATVLRGLGLDAVENQGLHGWRCAYPDRYGPCDCFDEMVEALTAAVLTPLDESFDLKTWLDAQEVKS